MTGLSRWRSMISGMHLVMKIAVLIYLSVVFQRHLVMPMTSILADRLFLLGHMLVGYRLAPSCQLFKPFLFGLLRAVGPPFPGTLCPACTPSQSPTPPRPLLRLAST